MNKTIANSLVACFLIYTLFISNFAFVAGSDILDNDSVVDLPNKIVDLIGDEVNNVSGGEELIGEVNNSEPIVKEEIGGNKTEEGISENVTLEERIVENISKKVINENISVGEKVEENVSENVIVNETFENISKEENISVELNLTGVFEREKIQEEVNESINYTLINGSQIEDLIEGNVSEELNLTERDFEIELIQMPAKVGEKVRWVKRVYGAPNSLNIELPADAEKVIKNKRLFSLMSLEPEVKDYVEVIYETSAPMIEEREIGKGKEVKVWAEKHYKNVTANVSIDFNLSVNESKKLNVYWKEENKYLDFKVADENFDGFIDSVEWIVPHLSNQTFEIFIDVLTVQSYPIVGGTWEVGFETNGIANLTIQGIDGTEFGEDLKFLELDCDGEKIKYEFIENGIFVKDYFCENISLEISKVLTTGKHDLEFRFGEEVDYAHNFAGKVGYKTQSGVYNLVGVNEFIPLDFSVNVSAAFVIAPNQMNQENTTAGSNGDPATYSDDSFVSLYLYNSTHIRAQRSVSDDGPVVVTWQVLEAMGGEFVVQRGGVDYSGTSLTINDSLSGSVNAENSMSWFYINTTYNANRGDVIQFYSNLIDNDTIQFTREDSAISTEITFRWVVVEWNLEKINNFVKGYTGEITGPDTSPDCFNIGTTINKSSSILFHQSHAINDNDGGLDTSTRAGYIQDDSTVCFYDYDGIYTAAVKWFVVDFIGITQREEDIQTGWTTTDYRDDISFSGSYDANNSLFWLSGTCNGDGTAKPRHTQWWEFDSSGFYVERTYGGQNREYSWQVLELPYYENLDLPQFSNYALNESYAKQNEFVRFSLDITDASDSINLVNGTIDGVNISFIQGVGNEWHYDYQCVSEENINFSYVYAEDKGYPLGSNFTDVNGINLICDLTNPVIDFVSPDTPANDSYIGNNYFDINVSVAENNFENITYDLYDSSGFVNSTTYVNLIDSIRFVNLSTENYYYNVTVYDLAGNKGVSETRKIYIDSENPLINFSGVTFSDGSIISGDTIDVGVSVIEDNEANITFYLYDEFGSLARTPTPYTDSRRSISWNLLSDGLYYYNVTIYDDFGHLNSTETRNITLDNIAPVVNYETGVEGDDSYFARNWIFVNISYVEDYYKNISFDLYNVTGLVNSQEFSDGMDHYNFTFLNDEEYWYNVTICDQANNCGVSDTQKLTLDNVNPFVSFGTGTESDNNNVSRNWIYVNSSITENNFENITFRLYNSQGIVNESTYVSNFDINFTDLGTGFYDYNISVYDKVGNLGNSTTRTIGVDVSGPLISIISPQSKAYGTGTNLLLNVSASDAIAGTDKCWWNIDDGVNSTIVCGDSTTFNTTDGQRIIKFYSNDTFGNLAMSQVNFLVSTTGPAITLNEPENDTVYNKSKEIFFNYSAIDPDGVEACSLWGDFNGTWMINQTDFSFGLIGNDADRTCSDTWPDSDCGASPASAEGDNTWNSCTTQGTIADESIEEMWVSDTEIISGKTLNVTCYIDPYGTSNEVYMWYYNGTGWKTIYSGTAPSGTNYNLTQSFMVDKVIGEQWVRCGIGYDPDDVSDFCVNAGNYFDNDDVNFTVVAAKEEGNFTVNLSSEGNYNWNIECNDSLNYNGTALSNYSVAIDLTNPLVDFGEGTLTDNSRVSQNYIYINASITEINFENITFDLYNKSGFVLNSQTYGDGTKNHTFVSLDDGIYDYNVTVYDKAGRKGVSGTRDIELDTINPSGSSNTPEDNYFTKETSQNLTATVSDIVELKDATLFIFNSTGHMIYSSLIALVGLTTATIGIIYNFLYDDVFDWFYRIRDSVDNEYNTTSHSIEIDSTAPAITFIASTEGDGEVVLQDWIFVNTSIYEKNYKNMTFWLYGEGRIVAPSPNTFSDLTRSVNWTVLPDGIYNYNVSSFDLAGNNGFSETREIILDTTNPVVVFSGVTKLDDSYVKGDSISVEVSVTEANEKNITFSRYGESFFENTYLDGRRTHSWTYLSEGIYYYNVTVFDEVELNGTTETRKITIDNTLPIIDYTTGTEINYANKSQNWIFLNASIMEENFDNITFWLYDRDGVESNVTFSDGTKEYNFTSLIDGTYYYNFTVYDKAGNNASSETRQMMLDTLNPNISFIVSTEDDLVIRNRNWVYLNMSLVENNFKEIKFILYDSNGLNEEQSFTDSTREYNFTGLSDDNYEYNVTVYDWAGNVNFTETRHIGLDSAGPVVSIVKPKSKTYGYNESLPLEHTVSDRVSNLDSCWWNIDGGINNSIVCNSATTFNTSVAPHTINFYANDTFGNLGYDSVSFFISITGPAIELVVPENNSFYAASTNVNFSFAANDPDVVGTCSLYGDWSGSWGLKETYSGSWNDVGFKHRKDIAISNVGSSTLVDYPLYLNVTSEYTDSGDYYDLRFFNGSCSEEQSSLLNYNVEYYDSNSADVWIRIPQISVGNETICMYYGNDNAEEEENVSGVWNNNYKVVYDMQSSGADLTFNNNDIASVIGSPVSDDSFGYGISFSNGNAWSMANVGYWEAQWFTRTQEIIFKTSNDVSSRQVLLAEGGGTNGYMMYILNGYLYARWWSENSGFSGDHLVVPIIGNRIYHAVSSYNNPGNYTLYLNGELIDTKVSPTEIRAHSGDGGIGYTGPTSKDFHDVTSSSGHYFLGTIYDIKVGDFYMDENMANQSYSMIFDENNVVNYTDEEDFVGFSILISQEGEYEWNVKCNDTIGYDSYALENYTFIMDVTNPVVLFGSQTEDGDENVGRDWIFMDVNVIENNFKNISFELYNNMGYKVQSSTYEDDTREHNFTGLSSGVYYYNVTVYDKADRSGTSETRNINLDLSLPNGTLNNPTSESYLNNLVQNLTGSFSDVTGLLNATLYVFNETGSLVFTSFVALAGVTYATVGIIYNFVKEGIYSWFYRVEDVVGNVYDTPNNTLTIDTTKPLINYASGVEDSGLVFERENVYVNVTISDLYFANLTFWLYNGDGVVLPSPNTFSNNKRNINWTNLPDGFYEYNVTVYDLANNHNSTETRNIVLDNLNPVIDFGSGTNPNGDFISGDIVFVDVVVTEANEENVTFNLYDEFGVNVRSNTFTDGRRTVSWNLLDDGIYYYNVTIYDRVGHFDSTGTRSIELDNVNPVISYGFGTENDGSVFSRDWIYFKVNIIEDNFKNVSLSLYNSSGLVSTQNFVDTTRDYNWTNLPDGNYWYDATTYDKAGNYDGAVTRGIILDNVNPLISFSTGTEANNFNKTADWIFINVSFIEENFKNITFELRDVNGVVNSTTYVNLVSSINWSGLNSKNYWYNVSIYDEAGNSNETEVRKIGIDYLGPSIQIINPKAKAYGYNISLPLNYNVNDAIVGNDICWYNLDVGSNVIVDCGGSSTFNTSNGQHTLHFYANDTFGNINYKNVTFLVSTTGPAIQLIDPEDNSFYSQATEVFFNYSAEDPDLTQSCSLYGSWNGGWHLNQTDFDWNKLNKLNKTCSEIWGFDCSIQPDQDNTFNDCETGTNSDEAVDEIWINVTDIKAGDTVNAICQFSVWNADDLYIWYYNGTGWRNLMQDLDTTYGTTTINKSVVFVADDNPGTHWVRCGLTYNSATETDACANTGTYYDNDDINFTVIEARTKGNFTLNLSEEGTHKWNIECNDSRGYYTWAVSNYSITFDVTNPVVDFGEGTLLDDSNVSQNYVYVNSSIVENNFENITFYLYNDSSLVDSEWFNDSTRDYTFTNLNDGNYYYNLTVFDSAGRSGSSGTRQIMIDTTEPLGSLGTPSDNSIVNNATQNLTGSFSDDNGLKEVVLFIFNQSGFVYSQVVNLGGVLGVTVGIMYKFLQDGIYDWFYQVEDTVGNLYNTTNHTIIVDTTLPLVDFILDTLDNDSYVVQDYIYLNTSVIETNFENITFILYAAEGIVAPSPNTFLNSKRDINWTNLGDGEYFYNVTVWDEAGNVNSSETRVITLDNILPVASYSTETEIDSANKSQDWIFVNTSVVETNFANITFRLYNDLGLVDSTFFSNSTRKINWTLLDEGEYFYNVTVWDKAGLKNDLSTRKINLDILKPLVDFASLTEEEGAQFERDWIYIDVNVVENNFKNMSYRLYDDESQLINETSFNFVVNDINFTASGENNTYYYEVVVYDWSGNGGKTSRRNMTLIDITTPSLVLTSPENITYPYTNGIRLDYDVNDVHLDNCWYSLDRGKNTSLSNCQGISMNFVDETSHTIELYVNDTMGYLNGSSVSFSVNSSLIETPTYRVLRGSSLFVDGSNTETIEITDMSKSFILHTSRGSDDGPDTLQVVSSFPRSDQVKFSNYDMGAGAIVDWSIVSGPEIKVQRGEISFDTESSLSLRIGQVNLSSSFIIVNTKLNSGVAGENVEGFFSGRFIDDSNVVFEREGGSANGVLSWQVVDWNGTTVQSGVLNISDGILSNNTGINQVDLNKSVLIFSNSLFWDNSVEDLMIKGNFTSNSEIEFSRVGSGGNVSISYFVVESDLFNAQGGDYTHLENSNVQEINLNSDLININRVFDVHSQENDGISTSFASGFVTQLIEDNNTINLQKGVGSDSGVTSWFAVEIKDLNNPIVNLTSPIKVYNYTSHLVGGFDFVIDDESNMSNCSLHGSWNGGWHLNQTIYLVDSEIENSFNSVDVGTSGFYNWSVECYDIYGNFGKSKNWTFSSYLPPTEPEFVNITQTANDGTGDIFLDWNDSSDVVKYRIYVGDNVSDFVLLNETTDTNYTDDTFAGNKRRFYKIEAWNPSSSNMSDYIFGVHVYELKHNIINPYGSIANRNWIGFPTNFSYLKNANDSLNEINGITSVSRLNTTTQKRVTCNEFSCPESFACTDTACNFNLVAGEGYEVSLNVSGSSSVNWSGVGIVYNPVQIDLVYDETGTRFNKNWISMTAFTNLKDADTLRSSLLGEDTVTNWNAELQKSEGKIYVCFPWGECIEIGTNFDIGMEKGYEISVTQDSEWTQV